MANPFSPGDLVVSVYGDGASGDTTTYTDNQAAPITLQDVSTSGVVGGQLVLPQTTTTNAAGTTEYAISGEYGSSSEGSLALSADGQSLALAGYGINAKTYNAGESNGNNVYGNAALAQSTSLSNSTTATPVSRVVADINYAGVVDTSTALFNVYNTNNPRSVATVNGSSFYLGGQGVKGDTTQGVFLAQDGASSATAINTTVDARTVELFNNQLYVSQDSKQGTGGTSNISTVGSGQPTTASPEAALPGISQSVTLNGSNGNNINGSTGTVNLSPENYYFANSSTLYVADGGAPKQGGAGDGGLQKWSLVGNTWQLDYTVSSGLNLQQATGSASSNFSTGLIGLTGKINANGTVSLYATTEPNFDTNTTYLVTTTDTLANTTAAQAGGESFKTLMTAAPDTVIRGVAFAPQAATCYVQGTRISTVGGDVAVEDLAVGDHVVTASGAQRPIRWLGHRTVDCARHPQPEIVLPVRITADAFGPSRPARDLVVSPGHAVAVDLLGEVLIPASALVNGATIRQEVVERVTYWHVELDSHDLLLAENLAAESYLDMGNRSFFGDGDTVMLHGAPDVVARSHADFCRPFHNDGEIVAFVRERLAARATTLGWSLVDDPLADLHLVVDGRRLEPEVRGLSARFLVPAEAKHVWLASEARIPAQSGAGNDPRTLGVCLAGLAIGDGFGAERIVTVDDSRLCIGFHAVEPGPQRWTAGRACLPADLWAGCAGGSVFLRVDLARPALPRWETTDTVTMGTVTV